jgi:hypothetical protein
MFKWKNIEFHCDYRWCIKDVSSACFQSLQAIFMETKGIAGKKVTRKLPKLAPHGHLLSKAGYSGQKPAVGDLASKQVLEACFGLESPFKLRFLDFGTGYDDPTETGFTPPRNNSFFMCVGSMVQSFFFQGLTKKERQFRANEIRGQHRQSLVILSMMPSTNGVWKDEGFVKHVLTLGKILGMALLCHIVLSRGADTMSTHDVLPNITPRI